MKIFLTGASGFIGTRVVPELTGAGHSVVGLSHSAEDAEYIEGAGVGVHEGNVEDLDSLRSGAAEADAVIHCAFNHDFAHLAENSEIDRLAIEALGETLAGSDRQLVVTSFTGLGNTVPGEPALESNDPVPEDANPRVATELGAAAVAASGVNVAVVRLPMVHDPLKQGIITAFIAMARKKGRSAYVGDGDNRFPSAAVLDVGELYRLVLERGAAGSRYHAVAEEGVPFRGIAEVIGRGLDVPVVSLDPDAAAEHFEFLAGFAGKDLPASSAQTQEQLGWHPSGPSLMSDLEQLQF